MKKDFLFKGINNVMVGKNAGYLMTHGSNNVLIGENAGSEITITDNIVIIGDNIKNIHDIDTDNCIKLGNQVYIGKTLFGEESIIFKKIKGE